MENVVELLKHAQTVDNRYSSPIVRAPWNEAGTSVYNQSLLKYA